MLVTSVRSVKGTVDLPGDKSISHRAALLAALAEGVTRISGFSSSADCASTIECLRSVGVGIEADGRHVTVLGAGKAGFKAPSSLLDCGNSGTTMRLMAGMLAGQRFDSVLTGDDSLRSRPMRRVIEPLEMMGAEIESVDGRAPLGVRGGRLLKGIEYTPPVASAQVKSCVLLAGLNAEGETGVVESVPTRDHTERMLRWFGVEVTEESGRDGTRIALSGEARLTARNVDVPADVSAAAFFLVAAACLEGSELEIRNVGLNPSRNAVVEFLRSCGASIESRRESAVCNEPRADLFVRGGLDSSTRPRVLRGGVIANLIDEVPVLAVLGTRLKGGLEIRDASELRVKESDRIASVVANLRKMGAEVEEFEDGLRVVESHLTGAVLDACHDHRIAMAFAVAGLMASGETRILGSECAAVSFPGFQAALEGVCRG